MSNYDYAAIGGFGGETVAPGAAAKGKGYWIVQSLWTKPFEGREGQLRKILHIAALSLAYAHRSGYKVAMHTDSRGYKLLLRYGYDRLRKTLDSIPESVPTMMFAAGKYYAMEAEGFVGKVHVDVDVFLKQPVLDVFYENKGIDLICQQDEVYDSREYDKKVKHMHVLGYPTCCRPGWQGSVNVGVMGFNDPILARRYFDNYKEGLDMYTAGMMEDYMAEQGLPYLFLDFILEQQTLSYMSQGCDVHALLPPRDASWVADKIGYQHLQGAGKYGEAVTYHVDQALQRLNKRLWQEAEKAAKSV